SFINLLLGKNKINKYILYKYNNTSTNFDVSLKNECIVRSFSLFIHPTFSNIFLLGMMISKHILIVFILYSKVNCGNKIENIETRVMAKFAS
ncbi:hypothetical protein ACJX0J_028175, partial [Zea mays]